MCFSQLNNIVKFNADRCAFNSTIFVLATNKACLVYDGKLVIDANFHTNDVAIRAAGPVTKFARKYYADHWTHANFNSKEVGIQASTFLTYLYTVTICLSSLTYSC